MKVPADLARSVRARWPHRADRWLTAVEPELDELCRRFSATPQHVIPARFAFVVVASTRDRWLIIRATADPDAPAQTVVANALAQLSIGPCIYAASTTETGTWTVMDKVTPGTPLADADARTVKLDALTAPLRAMAGVPAPADGLPSIVDWLRARLLDDHLADLPPGAARANNAERKQALDVLNALSTDTRAGLCHGDTSPWNILADASGRWLLIDPRGVHGEVEYDAAVMALKISTAVPSVPNVAELVANAAQLDPARVRAWETVARAARA